ncbi:MAG: ATP-binding protein [Alloprevotella sp.]
MTRTLLLFLLSILCLFTQADASPGRGIPFFVNYAPSAYGAHNRNFDVITDEAGRVYVANFEGLLYYDQTQWHTVHTPGIFRVTRLFRAGDGRIWVGGYNLLGYLEAGPQGMLVIHYVFSKDNKGFIGEVTAIGEEKGRIWIETSIGTRGLEDQSMKDFVIRASAAAQPEFYKGFRINQQLHTPDGSTLLATAGSGLVVLDAEGREHYCLSERNGLCDNNVNAIHLDASSNVWGATDNGVFLVNINSSFTHFGVTEGLSGDVQTICYSAAEGLYVGTLRGLFYKQPDGLFRQVQGIDHACWKIQSDTAGGVFACTAGGIYKVKGAQATLLKGGHTLFVHTAPNGGYYTAEIDGVYLNRGSERSQLNTIEKGIKMFTDRQGALWVNNIYGQLFRCTGTMKNLNRIVPKGKDGKGEVYKNTMFKYKGDIYVLSRVGLFRWNEDRQQLQPTDAGSLWKSESRYPQLVSPDAAQRIWLTDNEGKNLHAISGETDCSLLNAALHPLRNYEVRAIETEGDNLWVGWQNGVVLWDFSHIEHRNVPLNKAYYRRIVLNRDSVVWGGFSCEGKTLGARMPFDKLTFDNDVREIALYFSTDFIPSLGDTEYRYRLSESEPWSAWSTENSVRFVNPRPGSYRLEVEVRDRYGRISSMEPLALTVRYPVYLRWYSLAAYAVVLALLVFLLIRWRMHRLLKETERLEGIIRERTSQIVCQKEEIEEKSKNLEQALDCLTKTQYQLVRQEKMATVGTLTKGLVDRILNPMNYVNNFSHMSLGLVKDLKQNLDDAKEAMEEELYEDSADIIDMLSTNLQKIEEHGVNTSHMLKAMEEMLKERTPNFSPTDLAAVCRKNMEMLSSYYAKEIAECHISLSQLDPDMLVVAEVDADQVSRTIMSILANSVYALRKKYLQSPFEAKLSLNLRVEDDKICVCIHDNGIGIEDTIIDHIFDPFFTTKTTAEAVGVGLYISREVILNHGGDIRVQSEKNEFTEFVISLPVQQEHRPEETSRP